MRRAGCGPGPLGTPQHPQQVQQCDQKDLQPNRSEIIQTYRVSCIVQLGVFKVLNEQ